MESIVSNIIDRFHVSRKKGTVLVTIYACIVGVIVCLGYNVLYFELKLPNGAVAQILDLMDYLKQQPVDADCCTAQLYPDRLGGKTTDHHR